MARRCSLYELVRAREIPKLQYTEQLNVQYMGASHRVCDVGTAIAAQQQGHTWVARLLSRVTALGFGVDAPWWRTCLLFVVLAVMYHMAALAMWDAIGQWRPCLPWALMMLGVYVDEIGMHFLTGGCRDATPWHDYRHKPAVTADIIRKVALENGPAYLFMCIPNQILMYCFTASTCRAIGRPAPGVGRSLRGRCGGVRRNGRAVRSAVL